jgi:hypothetical protein
MTATAIDKPGEHPKVCSHILDPNLPSQSAFFGGAPGAAHFRPTLLMVVSGCSATEVGKRVFHSPLSPEDTSDNISPYSKC